MTTELERYRALGEAATGGPWWNESGVVHAKHPTRWTPAVHSCVHPCSVEEPADANFITTTRNVHSRVCDVLEAASRIAAERPETEIDEWGDEDSQNVDDAYARGRRAATWELANVAARALSALNAALAAERGQS